MKIRIQNKIFNGYFKWWYFFLLDLNDFFRKPFIFIIGDHNTFKNFTIKKTDLKNSDRSRNVLIYFLLDGIKFQEMQKKYPGILRFKTPTESEWKKNADGSESIGEVSTAPGKSVQFIEVDKEYIYYLEV